MPELLQDILGPGGAIARRLGERYEFRPQQLEMAAGGAGALAEGHHLLVEAGTGVGKSFAYLLPAIEFAVKNKKRVVISTHTISLQEQLIEKDIPLLRAVYPDEFTAVLVKGRSNYLCQRRLEQSRGRQNMLFDQTAAARIALDDRGVGRADDRRLAGRPAAAPRARRVGQGLRRARQLPRQEVPLLRELLLAVRQAPHAGRQHPRRQPRPVLLRPRACAWPA